MAMRPERLKATRLYPQVLPHEHGSSRGQLEEKKLVTIKRKEERNADINTKGKEKVTETTPKTANKDRKSALHQEHPINDSKMEKMKNETTSGVARGYPKGFVSKEVMELKVKQRNQTSRNGIGQNKTPDISHKKGLSEQTVTDGGTEKQLTSRKTKTTKIPHTYLQKETATNTWAKNSENTENKTERRKLNTLPPKRQAVKQFSILENKENLRLPAASGINTATNVDDMQRKENKDLNGGGKKRPGKYKVMAHDKSPPVSTRNSKLSQYTPPVEANKSKQTDGESKARQQSASTALSSSTSVTKTTSQTTSTRNTSTAIPKPQKRNIASKNATGFVTLDSLHILIMNANGKDDKGGSPAERRKNIIQNIVVKYMPHIALFQEFSWSGITGKTWSKYPLPEHYVYKGHYEASIMYDNRVSVCDLPATDLDTILKGLQASSNNRLKRTFPMDFNPISRMCTSKVTAPTKPALEFICISWHGQWNNSGRGRMKELQKIEYFEYFMEFLRNIREKYKLPIMAAGDYNVDMYSIEKCVESPFKLCLYEASMRRTVRGIVDYCIVTEDLDFSEIKWLELERDSTAYHPNAVLDHDPIVGVLGLSAIGATGAAMGFGKKNAWPSPIAKIKN